MYTIFGVDTKKQGKDFIVGFGRSALRSASVSFMLDRSLYSLSAVLWLEFHYICIILHLMSFINYGLAATGLSGSPSCLLNTFFSSIFLLLFLVLHCFISA